MIDELIVSLNSLIDMDENIKSDLRNYLYGRIVDVSVTILIQLYPLRQKRI